VKPREAAIGFIKARLPPILFSNESRAGGSSGVDAFGCLRSLRARSALDGVSWVQGGSVEIAVSHWLAACNRIGAVVCSLPRASLLLEAGFGLLSRRLRAYADANSVPSRSIACMMIASRRARATLALRIVDRWAIAKAQSLSLSWPL
jgi:hypothetical protein